MTIVFLAQKVTIRTEKRLLRGVIGTISAHYVKFEDAKKVRSYQQLYIDIGATAKEEAKKWE